MDVSDALNIALGDMVIRSAFKEEKMEDADTNKILVLHNEDEYKAAKLEADGFGDKPLKNGSPEYERAHRLAVAISAYEYMHGKVEAKKEIGDAAKAAAPEKERGDTTDHDERVNVLAREAAEKYFREATAWKHPENAIPLAPYIADAIRTALVDQYDKILCLESLNLSAGLSLHELRKVDHELAVARKDTERLQAALLEVFPFILDEPQEYQDPEPFRDLPDNHPDMGLAVADMRVSWLAQRKAYQALVDTAGEKTWKK